MNGFSHHPQLIYTITSSRFLESFLDNATKFLFFRTWRRERNFPQYSTFIPETWRHFYSCANAKKRKRFFHSEMEWKVRYIFLFSIFAKFRVIFVFCVHGKHTNEYFSYSRVCEYTRCTHRKSSVRKRERLCELVLSEKELFLHVSFEVITFVGILYIQRFMYSRLHTSRVTYLMIIYFKQITYIHSI
jgi:hypothetical protein